MGCESNADETYSLWYVGVIMSIGASICCNMGVNLQKYSFMQEVKKPASCKRSYIKQPYWVFGLFLVILGSLGDFGALGFIPQSLAVPVGGSTIVANVFFAHKFLHEKFSKRDGIGTTLILLGIVIVAAFANKSSGCHTLDELIQLYNRSSFIGYASSISIGIISLYGIVYHVRHIVFYYGKGSNKYQPYKTFHSLVYPTLSGIFGAQSVLFAKSVTQLIKSTINGKNQFTTFGTYAIAFSMFACIFLQIHWLAQGLEHFDAVFVVPIFQCVFISISIIGGAVYFDEFATMSMLNLSFFFIGVFITLSGVIILSQRDMTSLKPIQKLRACFHMIRFIKRIQKYRGFKYNWNGNEIKKIDENNKPNIKIKNKTNSIHPIDQQIQQTDSSFQLSIPSTSTSKSCL